MNGPLYLDFIGSGLWTIEDDPPCLYCEAKTERLRCLLNLLKLFFATEHSWRALEKCICRMIWLLICWWWWFPQFSDMVTKNRWAWSFFLNSLPDKEGRPPCNCQETAITLLLEIDFIQSFVWFFFASGIYIFLDNLGRTRNFEFFKILKLNKCFSLYLFIIGTEYIILLQDNTSLYCLFTKLLSKFQ